MSWNKMTEQRFPLLVKHHNDWKPLFENRDSQDLLRSGESSMGFKGSQVI